MHVEDCRSGPPAAPRPPRPRNETLSALERRAAARPPAADDPLFIVCTYSVDNRIDERATPPRRRGDAPARTNILCTFLYYR